MGDGDLCYIVISGDFELKSSLIAHYEDMIIFLVIDADTNLL